MMHGDVDGADERAEHTPEDHRCDDRSAHRSHAHVLLAVRRPRYGNTLAGRSAATGAVRRRSVRRPDGPRGEETCDMESAADSPIRAACAADTRGFRLLAMRTTRRGAHRMPTS